MSFKKYLYKKVIAAATALTMVFAATGCGESTAWIAKYDGLTVNAGVFIFYQTEAYSEATSILKKDNEDLDISDTKLLKTMMVENTDIKQWINNKATESTRIFIAVNSKFDELGLELTEDEKQEIESTVEMYWSYYSGTYEVNGIGKDSFRQMVEFDYKKRKVFLHYYDVGGEYEYSDNDMMSYLEGNYARTKVIQLQLKDGNGEELDEDGKKEIKAMAEDYRKRAMAGENFDDLMDEYSEYREKLTEEAQKTEDEGKEEPEVTEDQKTTEPVNTETTEGEVTGDQKTTEPVNDETTEGEVTEDQNTTEPVNDETAESEETEDVNTETTESEETGEPEETADLGATTGEEPSEDENTEDAPTTGSEDVNGEGEDDAENGDKADSDEKNTADSEENSENENSEETDEEKDPFEGETIYLKGSEEDGYQPSEKVNKAIFDDCFVNGDPVVIEDDDNLLVYVVQRLDILERTDLFEGEARENLLFEILEDEFENKALEWVPEDTINKNNKAYKRYDPFKLKF